MNMQIMINRFVIIYELKEWVLSNNSKKNLVRIMCDKPSCKVDKGIQSHGSRFKQAPTNLKKTIKCQQSFKIVWSH